MNRAEASLASFGDETADTILNALPHRSPPWGADGKPDQETETQHQEQREEILSRERRWEQLCNWPHQARYRLHSFEQ